MSGLGRSWSASVTFSLVTFPIALYTTVRERDLRFKRVHTACGTPVKSQPYVCQACDQQLESADDTLRAYQVGTPKNGQLVPLTDDDFASLPLRSVSDLEVTHFVDAAEVDPLLFDKTYYAAPDLKSKTGQKAFTLFRDTLAKTGKAALVKAARSSKEVPALIRAEGKMLVVSLLHWPDEVLGSAEVEEMIVDADVSEPERQLAEQLVEQMSADPEVIGELQDGYRAALEAVIDAKLTGGVVSRPAAAPAAAAADDDMLSKLQAALKAKAA